MKEKKPESVPPPASQASEIDSTNTLNQLTSMSWAWFMLRDLSIGTPHGAALVHWINTNSPSMTVWALVSYLFFKRAVESKEFRSQIKTILLNQVPEYAQKLKDVWLKQIQSLMSLEYSKIEKVING